MIDKDIILINLEKIGFSSKEAQVFLELIINPKSNGSQIAKALGYPRTTVYQQLDILQKKGYVTSFLDKEITFYEAIDLDELFDSYKKEIGTATRVLKNELSKVENSGKQKQFYNLNSFDEVKEKIKKSLKKAKYKVFINTNIDLSDFKKEIEKLKTNGVKVILFSFSNRNYEDLGIDLHLRKSFNPSITNNQQRIMVAIDETEAIIASNYEGNFNGIHSENRLLINIVIEHIRNDINLLRLNDKYGEESISSVALDL